MLAFAALAALAVGAPGPGSARCATPCGEAWIALKSCDPREPGSCDRFLATAERLAARVECASMGYTTCARAISEGMFADSYFAILSRLAFPERKPKPADTRRVRRALAVLGSPASVQTTEGDASPTWGSEIWHARALTRAGVLDDDALWRKQLDEAPPRTARASSTLAPQGKHRYDAVLAVDGRNETAWCAARGGEPPWIEVTAAPGAGPQPFRWVAVFPGYARDLASFQRNNRVIRMRVSTCAAPEDGVVVDLYDQDGPDQMQERRDVFFRPYWLDVPRGFTGCVRLTIVEVVRGRDDDTCLSEVVVLPE